MLDFTKGAPPLYYQIKEMLKDEIENEEYLPGDILPSELELQNKYNVSRITVSQAVKELVSDGYVSRARGKGTVVIANKIEEKLNKIMSFTDEMKMRGFEPTTKFVKVNIVKLNKTIAKFLELNKDDEAYKIERLRYVNGSPIVFFVTYLRRALNLPLDESQYMDSLYGLLKKNNNLTISKVKESFEAVAADEQLSECLDVEIQTPVLKRTRLSYDTSGNVLEYTICYYRADKYKYSVEIEV